MEADFWIPTVISAIALLISGIALDRASKAKRENDEIDVVDTMAECRSEWNKMKLRVANLKIEKRKSDERGDHYTKRLADIDRRSPNMARMAELIAPVKFEAADLWLGIDGSVDAIGLNLKQNEINRKNAREVLASIRVLDSSVDVLERLVDMLKINSMARLEFIEEWGDMTDAMPDDDCPLFDDFIGRIIEGDRESIPKAMADWLAERKSQRDASDT